MMAVKSKPPALDRILALWERVLIGALAFIVICALFLYLVLPIFLTSGTRDARRYEGEVMMGSLRDQARVFYKRTNSTPQSFVEAELPAVELKGQYFSVPDSIRIKGDKAEITCNPTHSASDGVGTMIFDWETGSSEITWD